MFEVTGLKQVEKRLTEVINERTENTIAGVRAAGLLVQGESNELAPQKTGLLINTSFSEVQEATVSASLRSKGATAIVGYTVEYAPDVHEAPDSVVFTKETAENKFLEKAVVRNFSEIFNIIARFAGRQ